MTSGSDIIYRRLDSMEEYEQAVVVQKEVWGFAEIEVVPSRLLLVAAEIGGQVIGALDGDRVIGYCFSIPGLKRGQEMYLHSHMLAVLPEYRNQGIGRRLKLEQRADALSRGIGLVEWTFDPLELKNAFLNIERLGAIIRRYVLNNYGITTSKLHMGLPTDRCVAEWHLSLPRTEAIIDGASRLREVAEERVAIPLAIDEIRRDDIAQAAEIQRVASETFMRCFDLGLAVTGFERTSEEGVYLLSQWK